MANLVVLSGNITKDADLRYTQNNKAVVNFSIAVSEGFGDNKKTQYFNIVSFGAEKLCQYLNKGTKVLVKGKLSNSSYEKDGVKHYKTEVVADNYGGIELLGSKNSSSTNDVFGGNKNDDLTPEPFDSSDMRF